MGISSVGADGWSGCLSNNVGGGVPMEVGGGRASSTTGWLVMV